MSDEFYFKCLNCGEVLSNEPIGTKHRNHCPKCLYSQHLDQDTSGDRRSNCFGKMAPIGLAYKDYKIDPFTNKQSGQLMVIHECIRCGKISANRIAGDDQEDIILKLFNESLNLSLDMVSKLEQSHIELLKKDDKEELLRQLFGNNFKKS